MKARFFLVIFVALWLSREVDAQIPGAPRRLRLPRRRQQPRQPPRRRPPAFAPVSNNVADCQAKCCASPLGQLLNNMTKPLTLASGGLIGPICPPLLSDSDLQKLLGPDSTASDAEKTAAAIKADEAGAAKRRAAIRYLGTVDCHYYPEAQDALISGLRGDRNECVRYEAALALSKGCCCTPKTMAALLVCANGTATDGHISETSERVRARPCTLCECARHAWATAATSKNSLPNARSSRRTAARRRQI